MKHNTNKKILVVLSVIFICFAPGVLAVQQGIFPKDPRAVSPPADLRPKSSANINLNTNGPQPAESDTGGLESSSKNNLDSSKSQPKNNFLPLIISSVIVLIIILFLVLIFFAFRSMRAENRN